MKFRSILFLMPVLVLVAVVTVSAATGAKIQFFNSNLSTATNTLALNFNLVNTGTDPITLANAKIRYYFTNDGTQADSFACDWATAGSSNITGTFATITPVTGADRYMEVGFTSAAGTLAAGAGTQVQIRVWKSDWSNFDQSNDYSFNTTATSFTDWSKVALYISGALYWGTPASGGTPIPTTPGIATPTPIVNRTPTPTGVTPTRTPTPAAITPTPTAVSNGNWYVAPNGNDSNNGSMSAPFKSITKAQSVASSGNLVYLRGGTYTNFTIAGSDSNYNFVHNITKSGITYAAYPGETPIFDFTGTTTAKRVAAFHIASGVTNVAFKGFKVTGVPVGAQKQSECFRIEGNAIFDQVTCCYNQANGFYFTTNGSGSCTNCDSYENIGIAGTSIGNTDGFGAHAYGVTFSYCRSWHNSDDGYDCIASYRSNTFDHCWAYNMTAGGDSNGFKIGGWGSSTPPSSVPVHTVRYCLSANNNAHGFYANHQPGQSANWTNNTAYNNKAGDFDMLERVSPTDATDIPGTREVLHYNIAYLSTIIVDSNLPAGNVTDNSWTKSGVTVSSADFQNLDPTQMTLPRNSDGSLPSITFMHLVNGSDLAGLGCF